MKSFSIDRENNITAFAKRKQVGAASDTFRTEAELSEVAAAWPANRLVDIWNSIPGFVPVKKFTNRKTAVLRIWKAIQSLDGGVAALAATSAESPAAERSKRARRKTRANQTGNAMRTPTAEFAVRPDSKNAKVLSML